MSIDEDTELRDLLTQTLETNGSFAKIRAQLRASIFLALDEDEMLQQKEPLMNTKIKSTLSTEEGRIMFCIVREFLEYFNLDFTLAVYDPESYLDSHYEYKDKEQIIKDLNIPNLMPELNTPILLQIINFCKYKTEKKNHSDLNELNGNTTFDINSPLFNKKDNEENPTKTLCENNDTFDVDKSTESSINELEISPPILKDIKHPKFENNKEKLKLSSQKLEKVNKSRNNFDLPPITNKNRSNEMLLPPLYTKEFKEINSQKELEKMFDLESLDNYEEDFMSESEIDLVLNKTDTKRDLVDDKMKDSPRKSTEDVDNDTNQNDNVSSVSSDFEFNSNIDDILTSC
ncbi:centrosomal protein 43-like [Onthophagus taurus]|uniref:centrosomal protein 43-like n=1 Tax=Onthophagus taurus TaxID=166361 RepID=UPI0039BE89FB